MKALLPKLSPNAIGLIGHTIINYPSAVQARESVATMVNEGVALIELQIPFSEPVADGPLFMRANHEAIAAGVTVQDCFTFMHEMSKVHKIPFVFMSYVNILYKQGYAAFAKQAAQMGAKGVIVPDLTLENAQEYLAACADHGLAAIQVIPPNVSEERLSKLAKASQGFVYAVARSGVTGMQTQFSQFFPAFLQRLRQHTDLPIAVGFGITSPDDVRFLKSYADYAVVGSQALRILQEQGIAKLQQFWHQLYEATQ
ncbi:MAG: tryptophan synthase subunit alpha [Gammaproteobacteria bacterium]